MSTAFTTADKIWSNVNLASFNPASNKPYGLMENQAIAVSDGVITAIEPASIMDEGQFSAEVIDCAGRWMTPGLIDCHTHLVFGGSRAAEFEMRLKGVPYEEIARKGGGILSTVKATRQASEQELYDLALPRLQSMMREGVTTIEVKSGYGLTVEDELKLLRVARRLGNEFPVRVVTTLLGAHALPPEYKDDADAYIDLVCEEMIPVAAAEKLADAVDVFCEGIGFSTDQCERVYRAAAKHGLAIKAHAEQLSDLKGSVIAARHGALSVDHLEYLADEDAAALAETGTVAVLLPGAFYFLRETKLPPMDALRSAGVKMALATDFNPGTSPFTSLRMMMNMGCTLFRMTPEETLAGTTCFAADALGLSDQAGRIEVGLAADLVLWDISHPAELAYQVGVNSVWQRIVAGEIANV